MSRFDSMIGMDTNNDEAYIEEVVDDEDLLQRFYNSPDFDEYKIDFGGGIFGITCRAVLEACDKNPEKLRKLIGIPKNKLNMDNLKIILNGCEAAVADAAYLA